MENSVGKIVNCDSKTELSFSLAPSDFHVEENFDLKVDSCLARRTPVVSYHGGGTKTLTTSLIFDKDADDALDLQKVQDFLKSLSKVNEKTKSIPMLLFKMGNFSLKGYLSRLAVTRGRFSSNGQCNQIQIQLNLIEVEESEDGIA